MGSMAEYVEAMRASTGREPTQIALTIAQCRALLELPPRKASDTEVRHRALGCFYQGIPLNCLNS